jgi:Fe2+ transport system protein FeoA
MGYLHPLVPAALRRVKFDEVKQGMRARVVSAPTGTPEAKRLSEMGLTEGAEFEVLKVAPLGDPVEIRLRGYRLCLRRKETVDVEIEVLEA